MNEFLEYDENTKSIKTLNLEDFSVEDLDIYLAELMEEINRIKLEIDKKKKLLNEAESLFK